MSENTNKVTYIAERNRNEPTDRSYGDPVRGVLVSIEADGQLRVALPGNQECLCDWLESSANAGLRLQAGDRLLVMPPVDDGQGLALGRIGRYQEPKPEPHLTLEAGESLTLKCGDASVELRKDGRALVKGEDVLLRAKRTQRIRAGSVAIN